MRCLIGIALLWLISVQVFAAPIDRAALARREALAAEMLVLDPPQTQITRAIDRFVTLKMAEAPEKDRAIFRLAMTKVLHVQALEKLTREAYTDIFTEAELSAMVEYYKKPEARTAREKQEQFHDRISPEIIKMLDQAMMRLQTAPSSGH